MCLLGNVMWSDELQSLKLFDLQFTGKAPAVCDIAYLLGPSMGARDSDYNRRFVTAIKQYTAAISAAGVDYGEEGERPFLSIPFQPLELPRSFPVYWFSKTDCKQLAAI